MSQPDAFVDHVCDLLQALGSVTPRHMFGAWGLYLDGVMFALIDGEPLYLKTDQATKARFAEAGAEPFTYEAKGRTISLSYREAPGGSLENPDDLLPWAGLALAAARRGRAAKTGRRRRR